GRTRYVITAMSLIKDPKGPPFLDVNVDIKGPLTYRQYCGVQLRGSAREASIAHFHGPLTVGPRTINWKLPPKLALEAGGTVDLPAVVGTMDAKHGCWVVVRSHNGEASAFPKGVFPIVEVELPPRAPGGRPVKARYDLDKFC